ncbi:hypothetical protein RJ639_046669 [Escallonia herrerae]|uniref:Uncharacterized protein n=1 Tax=Escallonia herrerae TaxID=1293975 RepID=A0AA89B0S2_9ASTE|nr:hypothetical protein RJ639_046669 [Escallonia herrerae]
MTSAKGLFVHAGKSFAIGLLTRRSLKIDRVGLCNVKACPALRNKSWSRDERGKKKKRKRKRKRKKKKKKKKKKASSLLPAANKKIPGIGSENQEFLEVPVGTPRLGNACGGGALTWHQ